MLLRPRQLGLTRIPDEILSVDKKKCRKFGPCGVGEKALYLNSFYIDRMYYVALSDVTRVFKRVAMSKGGFTGKGIFASIPYLVVQYGDGSEKQCNFKDETRVDELLAYLAKKCPELPLHSKEAEIRLAEKEKIREEKRNREVSPEAAEKIRELENFRGYLERNPELPVNLSISAKRKRTFERSNPAYKWVALAITLMGAASMGYGIYALANHLGMAMYFLLFGLAALFLFSGANVLPTSKNNRSYVEGRWESALEELTGYVERYPDAPIPPQYCHPGVISRLEDIFADERAANFDEAMEVLKQDLRSLNSGVEVEQEEFDEIMAIKPIFLVMGYQ